MRAIESLYSLNRGVVDRRGLARFDVKRLALAAETQENWIPKDLGPMILRPGFKYLGHTYSDSVTRLIPFIFAVDDTAILEVTGATLRVWINDQVLTRPSVATAITNGFFTTDIAGWTDLDESGATSDWGGAGYMRFLGNGTNRAIREQHVTCSTPNVEHGLKIIVGHGAVGLRVGSTSGADDYVSETTLLEGTHSIAFTPTGDFYVRFFSSASYYQRVTQCTIESAGAVTLPTPWFSTDEMNAIRFDQSGDVVFAACDGNQQRRIERRGTRPGARSFSSVIYTSPDGPFNVQNTTPVTLQASAISGNINLTASQAMFSTSHVGKLYSLTSTGQTVTSAISAQNVFTNSIRVTGLSANRAFTIGVTGVFTATVTLQQSFDNATWADIKTYTTASSASYNDTLDNVIAYYRIGIKTGDYTSGTATCTLTFGSGGIRGIVRTTGYTIPTVMTAEVLTALGSTDATSDWQAGMWSDADGWPTSVAIHEGRMWWAGRNGVWGSVSDAYDSFDDTFVGDAGPINRTIGSGPVDVVQWLVSLQALAMGAQGAEYRIRSSSIDEPITPTNFNLKACSTQGSGSVSGVKIDQSAYFVNRSGCKVFELTFDLRTYDFSANDLFELCPEIGRPGIKRIAVQRLPDTRVHCIRSDGTAVVGVLNRSEQVLAWTTVVTQGTIVDVCVLPAAAGDLDDQVYYAVQRTIDGATVVFLEKWAQEIDTRGGNLCLLADAYYTYSGASTYTVTAAHLPNTEVVVWADGADVGTDDSSSTWVQRYTTDGTGTIRLSSPATNVVVGLGYSATFTSAKMGLQAPGGSPLNQQKRANHIGVILADTHRKGIRFGSSLDYMDDMPAMENGTAVTTEVSETYDENLIEFPGKWTTDLRINIVAQAPRPATVMAVTLDMVQNS